MEHPSKHHLLTQSEIAKLAYEMYLLEGMPEGRELDHWLEAERVVLGRHPLPPGPYSPPDPSPTASGKVTTKPATKRRAVAKKV